jgi:hypothetical protein
MPKADIAGAVPKLTGFETGSAIIKITGFNGFRLS